jgi:hypothetical protein
MKYYAVIAVMVIFGICARFAYSDAGQIQVLPSAHRVLVVSENWIALRLQELHRPLECRLFSQTTPDVLLKLPSSTFASCPQPQCYCGARPMAQTRRSRCTFCESG